MLFKKPRKRKRTTRYRREGTRQLRVTLWLTREERDWLRNKARTVAPLTPRGLPRTGILVTEILRDWREREEES